MKTITFHNSGILDRKAFEVMGLSRKEGENNIGMFGTGMKYAIACLLRHGQKIRILSGGKRYVFNKKRDEFRGDEFDFVTVNGKQIGFTVELGKLWEPWMAYREFFTNAKDEGGGVEEGKFTEADTVIQVEGDLIASVHAERHKYFLEEGEPIFESDTVRIFDRASDALYYQGIKVADLKSGARYTYDMKRNVKLTEDRTVSDMLMIPWYIGTAIGQESTDKAFIESIVKAESGFETKIEFDGAYDPTDELLDVAERLWLEKRGMPNGFRNIFKARRNIEPAIKTMTERQTKQLETALLFLLEAGYDLLDQDIELIESAGDNLFGTGNGKIRLTDKAFEHGTFDLCATLLEEYVHAKFGHKDFDRGMQDWLFRQVIEQSARNADTII
jgi:hypothetical protein